MQHQKATQLLNLFFMHAIRIVLVNSIIYIFIITVLFSSIYSIYVTFGINWVGFRYFHHMQVIFSL